MNKNIDNDDDDNDLGNNNDRKKKNISVGQFYWYLESFNESEYISSSEIMFRDL